MFAALFREFLSADADTRLLLDRELPDLLARASPLAPALRDCPGVLAAAFCVHSATGWTRPQPTSGWPGRCSPPSTIWTWRACPG